MSRRRPSSVSAESPEELILSLEERARLRARHLERIARYADTSEPLMTITSDALRDAARLLVILADRSEAVA